MLSQLWQLLRKMPPEPTQQEHIQWLLDGLCSADIGTRAGAQRSFANLCVNRHGDYTPEDVIATLRALQEQDGLRDLGWILRHVEFVSLPEPALRTPPEVREAARQCWHLLRERIEPDYASKTLLHPSDAPLAEPETLLRPAQEDAMSSTNNLLRASRDEEHTQ